jgi:protein SCO1/2
MTIKARSVFVLLFGLFLVSCDTSSLPVINDLSNDTYSLVNQDSAAISFPNDFEGQPMVVGYIYTSCQSVCPAITANMKNISQQLSSEDQTHFVLVSFDPQRDTPSKLKAYLKSYELDPERFTLLTGDSTEVTRLLDTIGINAERKSMDGDSEMAMKGYMFNHTNQINLFDAQGRIRGEYGGSMVPPKQVIEDLNDLR